MSLPSERIALAIKQPDLESLPDPVLFETVAERVESARVYYRSIFD